MSEFLLAAHDDELLPTTVEDIEPSLNNRRANNKAQERKTGLQIGE